MEEKPNPGSEEAIKQGCKCPVMDNGYGEGAWGGVEYDGRKVFYFSQTCPLHQQEYTQAIGREEGKNA